MIKLLADKFGLPESTVSSAIGVLLNLLKEKTTGAEFEKFTAFVPGAAEMISQAPQTVMNAGSGLGGLLGMLGGQAADLAKASAALQQAGVPADKIVPLAKAFFEKAQEVAGPEMIDGISKNFPMLKTLLKT